MPNLKKEFSKIYDNYIDRIYRFIFVKVSSEEIAQDLCSETFLKGWEAFKEAQNPKSKARKIENPQAFLYQIARNLVTDHYRQKGRTQIVSADYVPIIDPRQEIDEKVALNSDMEQIRANLANLRENYQNVIIWHYLDDLPVSEMAKIMNKSEEATRVMLHRALKALKKVIQS